MTKSRIINILSFSTLIPLFLTFVFPIMKHETESYNVTFFWIWGLPYYSSFRAFIFTFPFILFSIGIVVEISFLLKTNSKLRKNNTKKEVVSKDWITRGRNIILYELLLILWLLFLIYLLYPFGIYYIEVPIFLPMIGGIMLIIVGNLSKNLDIDAKKITNKDSNFKLIYGLYIFVFILYSIFFSLFFTMLIFPDIYFSNVLYFRIFYNFYFIYPMLLILLIIMFEKFLHNIIIKSPHEQKQLRKLYIMTLVIIGIFLLIYSLLNWMRPTIRIFFSSFD